MWLINTQTYTLEYFVDPPSGLYAILSHTWTNNELSFQSFRDIQNAVNHEGFQKIRQTCHLAQNHGLNFVWVDTCCIDKSSSAELTEGINSMFQWYREAAVCYVYLSDMQAISAETIVVVDSIHPDQQFLESFGRCIWLTRGWTLQELIAPSKVVFLDSGWKPRATKSACIEFLATVTGIDQNVLEDVEKLESVLIAKRMSWAANRETTRTEDLAYCLLGIFDINLPLLYGEGHKAFARLQEAIAQQSCDLSLLAWRDANPNPNYRGIFAKSPSEFLGSHHMTHIHGGQVSEAEFTVTNKGLRIQTTLVQVDDGDQSFLTFNLGIIDPRWRYGANGWIGIYIANTPRGFVRIRPQEVYIAGSERGQRRRVGNSLVYLRKSLSSVQILTISNQFRNSLVLRYDYCPGMQVLDMQPRDLWCVPESTCLDPGVGLNVYFHLMMPGSDFLDSDSFSIIVACSTFGDGEPACAVWCEQDSLAWTEIDEFIKFPRDRSDFVAYDYLRNYFGGYMLNHEKTIYKNREGGIATVLVKLEPQRVGDEDVRYGLSVSCMWS